MSGGAVKFMYLQDPKNPRRIMTVARQIEDDNIRVGWAVCRPPVKDRGKVVKKGDEFSKQFGRDLAMIRMCHPRTARLIPLGDQKPMLAVINELLTEKGIVGKIVRGYVTQRFAKTEETCSEIH